MENRQSSSVVAFVLTAFVAACTLAGCSTTRWLAVASGEYVVGQGQGEAHEAAVAVIEKLEIDRDQRVAVFTLVDGSEIVAALVPRDQAAWPAGCPTNIYTDRMEVLDIAAETLTLESIVLSQPILVRSCPPDPVFVVLREDGEIGNARGASGTACSWTDTCIRFKPRRDVTWRVNDSTVSTDQEAPVSIDIVASGFEASEFPDPQTFVVQSGPTYGTIVNNINNIEGNGTITSDTDTDTDGSVTYRIVELVTYAPNTGFVGTDTFTYRICDNTGYCDTATVTVIVNPSSLTQEPPPLWRA